MKSDEHGRYLWWHSAISDTFCFPSVVHTADRPLPAQLLCGSEHKGEAPPAGGRAGRAGPSPSRPGTKGPQRNTIFFFFFLPAQVAICCSGPGLLVLAAPRSSPQGLSHLCHLLICPPPSLGEKGGRPLRPLR